MELNKETYILTKVENSINKEKKNIELQINENSFCSKKEIITKKTNTIPYLIVIIILVVIIVIVFVLNYEMIYE